MSSLSILLRRLDDSSSRLSLLTRELQIKASDTISAALGAELANRMLVDRAAFDRMQGSVDAVYSKMVPSGGPEPLSVDDFTRDEARLGLIRLLVQAQSIALDRTPDEKVQGKKQTMLKDDRAVAALLVSDTAERGLIEIDDELRQRFMQALQPFGPYDLAARLQRFLEIHRLILDIARAETGPAAAAAEEQKTGAPS